MSKRLRRFIETYRGSSFPTRIETADGATHVIKLRGAGNGTAALLSEFVVNRLASQAGLPVPDASVLELAKDHPWEYGTDEFHDLVRKSAGANLALSFLPGAQPLDLDRLASLPADFVAQVVTLDTAFLNLDRTAQSSNLLEDNPGRFWIVDHGSCRFLFSSAPSAGPWLPANHLFAGQADRIQPHWLRRMAAPSLVFTTVEAVPDEWMAEFNLDRETLRRSIVERLTQLAEWVERGSGSLAVTR